MRICMFVSSRTNLHTCTLPLAGSRSPLVKYARGSHIGFSSTSQTRSCALQMPRYVTFTWPSEISLKLFWCLPRIYFLKTKVIYIIFFIIQRVKARAIPCPHQPPTRADNTVWVAQGGTVNPCATKQLLPPDRVLRELYIYIYLYIRQIN